jgi:hypothetical protein
MKWKQALFVRKNEDQVEEFDLKKDSWEGWCTQKLQEASEVPLFFQVYIRQ